MKERFEHWRDFRGFMRDGFGRGGGGGEDHRGGGRHFGRGGRGMGRPFDHGELRVVILSLIAERPRHGYEIIKEIEDRLGGSYAPSPGVVYPTLTMLEELGSATVEERGGKKLYTITPQGQAELEAHKAVAERAMSRMREIAAAHGGGRAPQLVRAIENLKLALRLRERNGPLTEQQLRAIVSAIDAAAISIERS